MKNIAISCALLIGSLVLGFVMVQAQDKDSQSTEETQNESPKAEPIVLGPSLLQQGHDAYNNEDWVEAAHLYRRWVEADPQSEDGWYNLACSYALAGHKDKAQWALDRAVAAGWKDAEHASNDSDLTPRHDTEAFQRAITSMQANANAGTPDNSEHRFLKMVSTGTYLVLLPEGYNEEGNEAKTYPLCLLLHGSGSNEVKHSLMSNFGGRDEVIYVCPRAPHPHESVFHSGENGYTCWPPERSGDEINPMVLYADFAAECVRDARQHYRVRKGSVFAIGHSQGAALANCLAVLKPDLLKSYLAYAGYFDDAVFTDDAWSKVAKSGVRPWLVHCSPDPVVSVDGARAGAAKLKQAGCNVTLRVFDEGDHSFSQEVREACAEWAKIELLAEAGE